MSAACIGALLALERCSHKSAARIRALLVLERSTARRRVCSTAADSFGNNKGNIGSKVSGAVRIGVARAAEENWGETEDSVSRDCHRYQAARWMGDTRCARHRTCGDRRIGAGKDVAAGSAQRSSNCGDAGICVEQLGAWAVDGQVEPATGSSAAFAA